MGITHPAFALQKLVVQMTTGILIWSDAFA